MARPAPPSKNASFLAATALASKPASSLAFATAASRKKSPSAKISPKAASASAAAINIPKAPASKSPCPSLPAPAPSSSPSALSFPNPSPPPASTATAPPTSSPPSTPDFLIFCHSQPSRPTFSFPFAPANRSACVCEESLLSSFCEPSNVPTFKRPDVLDCPPRQSHARQYHKITIDILLLLL